MNDHVPAFWLLLCVGLHEIGWCRQTKQIGELLTLPEAAVSLRRPRALRPKSAWRRFFCRRAFCCCADRECAAALHSAPCRPSSVPPRVACTTSAAK